MTQIFKADGNVVPVTVVQAGPCQITQVKNLDTDGYVAAQIGYGEKNKLLKPLLGHLKNFPKYRYLREFRLEDGQEVKQGQTITVLAFTEGEKVKLTGISKGKGFQGVVRRHGFKGSPASHGHKDQLRMPGSIGSTGPAHIYKGTRMGGRMGNDSTTYNLEIVKIDEEKNLLYIKGALPGARNGLILIQAKGDLKEIIKQEAKVEEPIVEQVAPVVEAPVIEEAKISAEGEVVSNTEETAAVSETEVKS